MAQVTTVFNLNHSYVELLRVELCLLDLGLGFDNKLGNVMSKFQIHSVLFLNKLIKKYPPLELIC